MAIVALFHGGPMDGKYQALSVKMRWYRVPILDPPVGWGLMTELDMLETEPFGIGEYFLVREDPSGLHHYAMYRRVR